MNAFASCSSQNTLASRRGCPQSAFRGFSLVEVTLAMGIMSFALLAMLGMLPIGLSAFRSSIDATTQSQIAQRLFTQAQQSSFAALPNLSGDYYYDEEGFPADAIKFVYAAKLTVGIQAAKVPSVGNNSNNMLRVIKIEISKNRDVESMRAASPASLKTFSYLVADVGL